MRAWVVWAAGLVGAACGGGGERPPPCTGPECPCPVGTAACGGTCIDVTSDPLNCGGCGHDCLGAACSAGLCLPKTLVVVPNAPAAIALDGDDVVFATGGAITSSGAVYRLPGVGTLEVVYRGLGAEPALAVTADTILVADSGQPDACLTSSSAGDILAITGGEVTIYSAGRRCAHWLHPVDGGLVWVEEAPLRTLNTGDPGSWIARLPGGASPGDPPAMLYGPRSNGIRDLVQSGDTLIWRQSTFSTGELMQMPLEGGAAGSIASVAGELGGHTADAARLAYAWKNERINRLVVRTLATGEQRTVAEFEDPFLGGTPDWQLALDDSFAYWIKAGDLWAVDLRSSGHRRLASGVVELAQDDRFLYALRRLQHGGGPRTEVLRIRKPAALGQPELEPLACRGPLKDCSSDPFLDACVDVRADPNHCGDCGVTCDPGEVCAGGGCVCNPTSLVCGGTCVDPATDKDNCGRCGRSCGGGDCVGGDCKPVQIGERTGIIVQDADALYYAANGQVKRLDKQSHGATTLAQLAVYSLAIDANQLYAIASAGSPFGSIHALAKSGPSSPTPLYANRFDPRQLAVAGDAVLWVEDVSFGFPVQLVHAALDGSGIRGSFPTAGLYPGSHDDQPADIAVAGSTVYWLLQGFLNNAGEPRGAIVRIDLAAQPATMALVATLDRSPEALAVVGDRLYVTTREAAPGVLLSVPAAGGPVAVHVSGLADVGDLTSTVGGDLFWVDGTSSEWMIRHRAPGAVVPRVVQSTPVQRETRLLVDGDRLYTASSSYGIFMMTR